MHISSIILLSAFATAFFCSKECAAKPAAVAVAAAASAAASAAAVAAAASAAASAAAVAAAAVAAATNNHRRANYQKSPASRYRSPRGIPDVLPDQFFGTFDLDHSENFDEYLTAKRYGWFTRKLVIFATFRKVFTRTDSKTLFDFSNLTSKKDVHYKNIELGKAFQGEGLDSTKHEIIFTLKDGHLFEHHKPLGGGDAKEETFEYLFEGDFLLVRMSFNGVDGRRYYKRLP
ncbi:hypothetical protein L5515_017472 [Caenorhabditis briggsae]|uniref:Cytosolic fatty-acid binding proteins domain-containing protein n=1 Tax=Caenorhabditis briggsae TaxID=6238 RepID=A0AAE9JRK6_CAEBR|nr:hypothetical protein L5515_017472 [Caenorhabditis briggsae]